MRALDTPPQRNTTAFPRAQFWGKQRGIYANVMGFLGGVNFAILVTRVCLHYPRAPAASIVRKFFKLFNSWSWSECLPVMVTGIDRGGPAAHLVWQQRFDRREVFPIITPCYPASNSTFNVSVRTARYATSPLPAAVRRPPVCVCMLTPGITLSQHWLGRGRCDPACAHFSTALEHFLEIASNASSPTPTCFCGAVQDCTRSIMLQEIARGAALVDGASLKAGKHLSLEQLTHPLNFFGAGAFYNYLQVVAAASSVEDSSAWSGFVNTRIKHLVNALHHSRGQAITARPWPTEIRIPMCAATQLRSGST
jgi:poly(A) polymerase Pap1